MAKNFIKFDKIQKIRPSHDKIIKKVFFLWRSVFQIKSSVNPINYNVLQRESILFSILLEKQDSQNELYSYNHYCPDIGKK